MAFLCPVRISRRRRKRQDGENLAKNGAPKGRITGSDSVDSLEVLGKGNDEEEVIDFEPRKMIVLHDFIPCVEDEVPVKRGDHIKTLYQENDWSYIINREGREGFIPFTYSVTEDEYEKRKERQKSASFQKKYFRNSSFIDSMATEAGFKPAQFSKQSYGDFIVKFDFDASEEDDISVQKGEIVVVLNKEDSDWYWVKRKNRSEGFIPKNFLTRIEQIMPSRSLINEALVSRSSPCLNKDIENTPYSFEPVSNSYSLLHAAGNGKPVVNARPLPQLQNNTEKGIYSPPHTPVIIADPLSQTPSEDYISFSNITRAMPLIGTVANLSSPGDSSSSQSYLHTPLITADLHVFSSTSRDHYRSLTNTSTIPVSSTDNFPAGTDSSQSSPSLHFTDANLFLTSGVDFLPPSTNKSRTSSISMSSTLAGNGGRNSLQTLKAACKSFSSMSMIEQVPSFSDNVQTKSNSHSMRFQQRRNSNDLILHGQELVCTDTYMGRTLDELSIHKGDWIYADVKDRDMQGWLWAYSPSTKNQGFVPKSCVRPPATTPL